ASGATSNEPTNAPDGQPDHPHSAPPDDEMEVSTPSPYATIHSAPQLSERNIVLSERIRKMAIQRGLDAGIGRGLVNPGKVSAEEWKRRLLDFKRTRTP